MIGKRPAISEARPRVELLGWAERCRGASLKAEPSVSAAARFRQDVVQNSRRYAFAQMCRRRPHRLDLAVLRVELLERAASEKFVIFPRAPERDRRIAQVFDRQRVSAFRRGEAAHVREVFGEQFADFAAA